MHETNFKHFILGDFGETYKNNTAVWIFVLHLNIPQVQNWSQNLKQAHLIGLIHTWTDTLKLN